MKDVRIREGVERQTKKRARKRVGRGIKRDKEVARKS